MLAQNEYEMQHKITYYECDSQGELTMGMLINLALLVSEEQSDQVGVGSEVVQSFGGGWVITNYEINIEKFPQVNETVVLGTRATSYNKYFAIREFWINDLDGNPCATITSMFVYMDLATRKLIQIPSEILAPFNSEFVKRIARVEKPVAIADDEDSKARQYHVRYFDIDANQHVNNAHYFDWMLDTLGDEFLSQHQMTKMVIKYDLEVRYKAGDITSEVVVDDLITKHQIGTQGQLNAEANCWWKNRT